MLALGAYASVIASLCCSIHFTSVFASPSFLLRVFVRRFGSDERRRQSSSHSHSRARPLDAGSSAGFSSEDFRDNPACGFLRRNIRPLALNDNSRLLKTEASPTDSASGCGSFNTPFHIFGERRFARLETNGEHCASAQTKRIEFFVSFRFNSSTSNRESAFRIQISLPFQIKLSHFVVRPQHFCMMNELRPRRRKLFFQEFSQAAV